MRLKSGRYQCAGHACPAPDCTSASTDVRSVFLEKVSSSPFSASYRRSRLCVLFSSKNKLLDRCLSRRAYFNFKTLICLFDTPDFHVAGFGGEKSLVLTTLSPVGTRNGVLGGAFMSVGGACLAAGLVVLSKFQRQPRCGQGAAV